MHAVRRVVLDRPWVLILAALVVAFAWWVLQTRKQDHTVRAAFSSGVSLVPGLDVQIDGVDVGKVEKVKYEDGQALVDLGISDSSAWPLHQGTKAEIRFGTTVGNGTRSVSLHPGPTNAPEIPDNGIIARKDTITPVEFDEIFDTLDARTRQRLRAASQGTADAVDGREARIKSALKSAPGATETVNGVLGELAADGDALQGLVANGDRVTGTLARRQETVSDLVSVAAQTFSAFGARTQQIRASLDRFAPMLDDTKSIMARLDTSLDKADSLLQAVQPGAKELPSLAREAGPALVQLQDTAPTAARTLRTVRDVSPDLSKLLDVATPFMAPAAKAVDQLAPAMHCIRPYAPEIAGWASTWGGFTQNYDTVAHYPRIHLREGATSVNGFLPNSELFTSLSNLGLADYRYAMPRPPGLNAGKPQFLPECGITKDALDATKDPEKP
ncbi:MlaD family protein [Patulibacter brassicae]|uniref:MlaD family protein n=1 Tax=Patulibacter brassicae TaxID=1705717 RepID=A0ABU4VFY8_9ACTN|nr:MlaD family protein [Patulibacter brassicae]